MDSIRTASRQILFGELLVLFKRSCHGAKKRLRDAVSNDLKNMKLFEESWYTLAQDRVKWRLWLTIVCQL